MRSLLFASAIACAVSFNIAHAATQTATMGVSADVPTICSLTTTPIDFGNVNLTGVTNGTGTVVVTCTQGGDYNVGLDTGPHPTAGQRAVESGANTLNYNLYSDTDYSIAWGNTVGTDTVAGVGTATAQTLTVYAQIPGGQTLISGNGTAYTDTVTATVTY